MTKEEVKKDLRKIFRSMDFICKKFLANEKSKDFETYCNIYQQLGQAWEFLGLQCRHWDGYRKIRDKKEACKVCGKVKGIDDYYYLLPKKGSKTIGKKLLPNSKKTFKNMKAAARLHDSLLFHGAKMNVEVHNSYSSSLMGKKINLMAERIVSLKESGVSCSIDQHLVNVEFEKSKGKKKYGEFPWELRKEHLKKFPVIFDFDKDYKFLGLTIFR